MGFQPGANLYTQGFGSKPEMVEVPHYDNRNPTPNDNLYPNGKFWLNVGQSLWYLLSNPYSQATGSLQANWVELYPSFTSNLNFVTNSGTAIPSADIINVLGAAGTVTTGSGNTITITAGAAPFVPNAVLQVFDDFVGVNLIASFDSQQGWLARNFPTLSQSDVNHPGVVSNGSFNTSSASLFLSASSASGIVKPFLLGGGAITLNWVVKLATLSNGTNGYTYRMGFGDTQAADEVNGIYFEYSDGENSGNWIIKTANSSTRTSTNTSTAVDTNYHNFQININAAGTSTQFFIDGVSQGTITTNIPSAGITPFIDITRNSGTIAANSILIDLFYLQEILTTSR